MGIARTLLFFYVVYYIIIMFNIDMKSKLMYLLGRQEVLVFARIINVIKLHRGYEKFH